MADLERGQRIKELREARHLTQEAAAEALDVTLRGYQEWEAGGGIKWDNVKKLAAFHKVEADFVMNGPKGQTPDPFHDPVMERLDDLADQMAAIETQLALLVAAQEPRNRSVAKPRRARTSAKKSAAG